MKKKILILGGSGFLGNNLCGYLIKKDYEVYSYDRLFSVKQKKVHFIEGDFFDDARLEAAIKGMDCVIHAISTVNPGNSNELYMYGYSRELLQTIKLCNMLVGEKTKMVFLSSGGTVYGDHQKQPIDESVLPRPINHYGNIKLCIENTMRTFNYQMGTQFIIARISNPYGPGQDFHKGVGFIDAVLKNTIEGLPVQIWGDGDNVRDYVYIDDVCKMLECLIRYCGNRETFNISSGKGYTQNAVIEILRGMGLSPKVIYKERRSVDVRKIILSNAQICSLWNGEPIGLVKGIELYYRYLRESNI